MSKFSGNDDKFDEVRALNLPLGHYAITSSGTLGIREVRAIGDVDLIVDDELWFHLSEHYLVTRDGGFDRIQIGPNIEIFGRDSFLASRIVEPTVHEQIHTADHIAGLPFVKLEHILHFKKNVLSRDPLRHKQVNDRFDIQTIETILGLARTKPVPA
jgi:hypothetical protein